MLRFIVNAVLVFFFLIFTLPLMGIFWLMGRGKARDFGSLRVVQCAFKMVTYFSGTKVTIIGEENIPDEPVLYIANHRSIFDIILTYSRVKRLTSYVAKDSLEKIPLLAQWMKLLHCLFLNRENPKEGLKTILTAIEHIKTGISVCIFPEGGRNKGEELSMLPFKDGAFKISTKTNCAIIPMSINNTNYIFEEQFPRIKRTHVVIEYGKPIYPNSLPAPDKKRVGSYVQKIIQDTINKNSVLLGEA